jgi:hypothetical protein
VVAEASLELLDAPSEWYYDRHTAQLYLYPPDGLSPAQSGLSIRAKARCDHYYCFIPLPPAVSQRSKSRWPLPPPRRFCLL